jgi:hypothetical protein
MFLMVNHLIPMLPQTKKKPTQSNTSGAQLRRLTR